jgi:hypothetical protein
MDTGHWEYPDDFDPDDWFGFIYRITNLITQQEYIGRKQFNNRRRKKVKGRRNRKVVVSDSDWKSYMSSSDYVKADIEQLGKENFRFEIIELCKTKGDMVYREIEQQWDEKVLEARLPNGEPKYYNRSIGNIRFTLSEYLQEARRNQPKKHFTHSEETRKKMSESRKGMKFSEEHRANMSKARANQVFTAEALEKRSRSLKKLRWYHNGETSIRIPSDDGRKPRNN